MEFVLDLGVEDVHSFCMLYIANFPLNVTLLLSEDDTRVFFPPFTVLPMLYSDCTCYFLDIFETSFLFSFFKESTIITEKKTC